MFLSYTKTTLKRLKYLFILTCATAIIFPLVNIYYIFPSISKLVIDNIEDEARRIAQHLASNVVTEDNRLKERQDIEDAAGKIKTDFNLDKLKVFGSLRPRHLKPVIGLLRGLTDPVVGLSMGQTAENLFAYT